MRRLWNALTGFLVVGALLPALVVVASAGPASADTAPGLGDFVLHRGSNNLPPRVQALDDRLPKLGVQNILRQANRRAEFGGTIIDPSCAADAFGGQGLEVPHWCFDRSDTGVINGDLDGNVEWMPQGVTTVADAQADQRWGEKQAILVSWYDKRIAPDKGVRVSFLDPETGLYQHVLLVYPFISTRGDPGEPSYEILQTPQDGDRPGIHAGGIVWYGNYLYVVDTKRGIRVFDMRYIFDLKTADNGDTSDRNQIGRRLGDCPDNGSATVRNCYYGFGYRYVMPQVDLWVNDGGHNDGDHSCETSGPPKFSFIGLDRSTVPDRLVTGEYCRNPDGLTDRDGRVATWPLNGDNGQPLPSGDGRWHANFAYRLPRPNIQGAVAYDGTWYLSRSRGRDSNGHLIEASANGSPTGTLSVDQTRWAAIGVEDLSYWPGRNQIWTVTEYPGLRALYFCTPDAPPAREDMICGEVP